MKKLLILACCLVSACYVNSQELTFTAPGGKLGKINISAGNLENNEITLALKVEWLDKKKMRPIEDKESLIVFNKNDVKIFDNNTIYCKTFNETSNNKIYFNSTLSLTFVVNEETVIENNQLLIDFGFHYAANLENALDKNRWNKFIAMSPRNYKAKIFIDSKSILDINAPVITVLNPEGVMSGFEPVIYENQMEVKVKIKERNKLREVLINNVKAIPISDDTYIATISFDLMGGTHPIKINATDESGNKGDYQFFVETRMPDELAASMLVSKKESEMVSDVDTLIPRIGKIYENRYALIIGNEDYKTHQKGLNYESNVEFARRDADIFKQYAIKTLGIKESNIIFMTDAKAVEMHRGVGQLSALLKATNGEGEAIVYFAGHGFPDEKTKEAYIIPVDVSGNDLEFGVKLKDLYAKLYENPSKGVTVFLDACFSGGGREQGLIAARGVRIKPKDNYIKGNLMVFSASSGNESALPYRDKFHGIFTYYLLKALKDSKGEITMSELVDAVTKKVSTSCIIHNNKEQTPTINVSPDMGDKWKEWQLNY